MRVLEHRRHSRRDPFGVHLNAEGIALARRVRREVGGFDRVVTSPKPRAVETAEALGFVHPLVVPALGEMPEEVVAVGEGSGPVTFADYVRAVREDPAARAYATGQLTLWGEVLGSVSEGGRVLMISHGGTIEFGASLALPDAARTWGASLGYLEGVRLERDKGRWTRGEVLRV